MDRIKVAAMLLSEAIDIFDGLLEVERKGTAHLSIKEKGPTHAELAVVRETMQESATLIRECSHSPNGQTG